jgi:D-alanyl-D-alanine carboxypeptidase (penicillin-binding protein 5/6)
MKKMNIFAVLILAAVMLTMITPPALALDDPDIKAKAALLVEADSGKVLFENNKDMKLVPDSLVKIMTLLLAVEAVEEGKFTLNDPVTASDTSWEGISSDSVTQNIQPGETLRLGDLMYCAFIGSANEACNIIAEYIGGGKTSFVDMMNERAAELGCTGTQFANAHGLKDPNQYTTAWDQYLIMREANRHQLFKKIGGTLSYTVPSTNLSTSRSVSNTNMMLRSNNSYFFKYCTMGKSSASYEDGYGYVSTARNDEMTLISVVMGAQSVILEDGTTQVQSYSETQRLYQWGFDNFIWQTAVSQTDLVAKAPVELGDGADFVNLHPSESIFILTQNDITPEQITREITIYSAEEGTALKAPIRAGDILGEMTVFLSGEKCGFVKLLANTDIELKRMEFFKEQVKNTLSNFWVRLIIVLFVLFFGGYIVLVIRYNRIRSVRLKKIEEAKRKIIEERQQVHK